MVAFGKMTVVFLVFSKSNGFGGHHHSVRETVHALNEEGIRSGTIVYGPSDSQILVNPHTSFGYISSTQSVRQAVSALKSLLNEYQSNILFCCDEVTVRLATLCSSSLPLHIIPLKPGGPRSRWWPTTAGHFIVYSDEDKNYLTSLRRFKGVEVHNIPNRVATPVINDAGRMQIAKNLLLDEGSPAVVALGRIAPKKRLIFEHGWQLYCQLKQSQPNLKFIAAGIAEDIATVNDLRQMIRGDDHAMLTGEAEVTNNFPSLMACSSVVVAMGRTAMEAMALRKCVAIPNEKLGCPVILTAQNYPEIARCNLTHRADMTPAMEAENQQWLSRLIKQTTTFNQLGLDCGQIFDEFLSIKRGINRFKDIISSLEHHSPYKDSFTSCWMARLRIFRKTGQI